MKPVELPYRQIPEYPVQYSATTVAARLLDGLGFRYYWATEGLREQDLSHKASETSRSTAETIDHILGLSQMTLNSLKQIPNTGGGEDLSFEEKRQATLLNIKEASELLKAATDADMENYKIIFERGDSRSEFPFWNNLNGPIADALWHVGQIVSNRRASGNPLNGKVSVFSGRVRE
ncbi:MAG: hypothetical protein AAFO94_05065 [Bacteroidota bacterium]